MSKLDYRAAHMCWLILPKLDSLLKVHVGVQSTITASVQRKENIKTQSGKKGNKSRKFTFKSFYLPVCIQIFEPDPLSMFVHACAFMYVCFDY